MHPEVPVGKSDLTEGEKSGSPSSSSSLSSSEDFFQMDASEHSKSTTDTTGPLKLDEDAHLALEDTEIEISSYPFPKCGEFDQWSPGPTPPLEVSGLIPESSLDGASARQSPPIQVMGRSGDYPDLYRIPSAVFARNKSSTPMEWSVASNESLFSIHMGNNSFSRDHIFLMGMSGELGKSGNLINFPDFPVSLPPDTAVPDTANKSTDLGEHLGVTEAAAETMREVLRTTAEDRRKEKMPPAEGIRLSSSHSHRSDGSEASIISFAFPILTGEGGRRSVSVKVDSEQQSQLQSQPRTPGATQNAARTKWFRCFSCWSENCKLFHIPRNKHST